MLLVISAILLLFVLLAWHLLSKEPIKLRYLFGLGVFIVAIYWAVL
ncbi:hypothetical protein [uncultured Tateyamaria sp.]|nr:hypothetical protein [uncultured Tateyamaria sp.]